MKRLRTSLRWGIGLLEGALSKRFGRGQPPKVLWVYIANDVQHLRSDTRHLVLCPDSEKGQKCGEIWYFVQFRESVNRGDQRNNSLTKGRSGIHWETCDLTGGKGAWKPMKTS